MKIIADLHIHSKYSRAVSKLMNLQNIADWCRIKGVKVVGTGDFTHPKWFSEIKEELESCEQGLFCLREEEQEIRFMLTSEISCIYKKAGKVRKNHIIIMAPSIRAVEKINAELGQIGNLISDGRPILGLDAKELLKIVLDADENCLFVPAHAWTPWFSVFGSKSGFDSLEECFDDYSKYVYAIETGLSSDPAMNWRLSALDKVTLISNSDAHSMQKIGREANVFDTELNYNSIISAIKEKDVKKFLYTIEFFPEEGKYHYDGHANCKISLKPEETKKNKNICPKCKKELVIGVLNRVEELADRKEGFTPPNAIPYKSLIPLNEIIAESFGVSTTSKQVFAYYNNLIKEVGAELMILLDANEKQIAEKSSPEIAKAILKARAGEVEIEPGYDGVYGKIKIFDGKKFSNGKRKILAQKSLF